MKTKKAVVIGAAGYTGVELIRLLLRHPQVDIVALVANTQGGEEIGSVYPHLCTAGLPELVILDQVDFSSVDLAFCCLPHGTTQQVVRILPDDLLIIDLSADFRLRDTQLYERYYGHEHYAPELQKQAVYGLSEYYRQEIKQARIIACPGCYPTSVLLPLLPLVRMGLIQTDNIIIDAKSGISGAGRSAKREMLFTEINEGISAYSVGCHRHAPEIEQELGIETVSFTPHLVPMNRGILSTIHVRLSSGVSVANAREALAEAYADEEFVQLLPEGSCPATHNLRGSNYCHINIFASRIEGHAIIVSAIDNLVKGASGQAVQNMNIRYGWAENTALQDHAIFP